jgi:hypothetical protein
MTRKRRTATISRNRPISPKMAMRAFNGMAVTQTDRNRTSWD